MYRRQKNLVYCNDDENQVRNHEYRKSGTQFVRYDTVSSLTKGPIWRECKKTGRNKKAIFFPPWRQFLRYDVFEVAVKAHLWVIGVQASVIHIHCCFSSTAPDWQGAMINVVVLFADGFFRTSIHISDPIDLTWSFRINKFVVGEFRG